MTLRKAKLKSGVLKVWVILDRKGKPLDVILFKPPADYPAKARRGVVTLDPPKQAGRSR